jgi:hypothetical protein
MRALKKWGNLLMAKVMPVLFGIPTSRNKAESRLLQPISHIRPYRYDYFVLDFKPSTIPRRA